MEKIRKYNEEKGSYSDSFRSFVSSDVDINSGGGVDGRRGGCVGERGFVKGMRHYDRSFQFDSPTSQNKPRRGKDHFYFILDLYFFFLYQFLDLYL
jgi:hypothetical protein